jgi:hypothetical protein
MTAAHIEAGVTHDASVLLADESRLGLRGQVRRVLAPRGVAAAQRLPLNYQWAYLLLAVDPRAGTLRWHWLERCRAGPIKATLAAWTLDAIVWDDAGAHRARLLAGLPTARVSGCRRTAPNSTRPSASSRKSADAPRAASTTPSPTSRPSPTPSSLDSPPSPHAFDVPAAGPGSPTPSTDSPTRPPHGRHPLPESVLAR